MHILFFLCELIGYPFFSRAQLEQWDVLTPKYPFIIVTFVCRVQYGACGRIYNQLQSVSVCVRAHGLCGPNISKRLDIEDRFQSSTNWKWHKTNRMVT